MITTITVIATRMKHTIITTTKNTLGVLTNIKTVDIDLPTAAADTIIAITTAMTLFPFVFFFIAGFMSIIALLLLIVL